MFGGFNVNAESYQQKLSKMKKLADILVNSSGSSVKLKIPPILESNNSLTNFKL